MKKILFVCTGNICRSPTAEGVLRARTHSAGISSQFTIDSAGTHAYHIGEPPDPRSIAVAKKRDIDISGLRARKVLPKDFTEFDLILGLDYEHVTHLRRMAPSGSKAAIALFLDYADSVAGGDVPDPYYGSARDFEHVLDLIEAGSDALLKKMSLD
jgi:protein-tyrosine phosphatase